MKVISGVYGGVTTTELDTLAAETAAAMTTKHPDYAVLAARIAVSNLHKETKKPFSGEIIEACIVHDSICQIMLACNWLTPKQSPLAISIGAWLSTLSILFPWATGGV